MKDWNIKLQLGNWIATIPFKGKTAKDAHQRAIDLLNQNTNLENAIAISAEFHTNKNFSTFYDRLGEKVNGFTGIYDLIATMAVALTDFELKHGGCPGAWEEMPTGRDWIEFVEAYVSEYIEVSLSDHAPANPVKIIQWLEANPA